MDNHRLEKFNAAVDRADLARDEQREAAGATFDLMKALKESLAKYPQCAVCKKAITDPSHVVTFKATDDSPSVALHKDACLNRFESMNRLGQILMVDEFADFPAPHDAPEPRTDLSCVFTLQERAGYPCWRCTVCHQWENEPTQRECPGFCAHHTCNLPY